MQENIKIIKTLFCAIVISFVAFALFSFGGILLINVLKNYFNISNDYLNEFLNWLKTISSGFLTSAFISLTICVVQFKQSLSDAIFEFKDKQTKLLNIANFEPLNTIIPYDLMYDYLQELEYNKQMSVANKKIKVKSERIKLKYKNKNKIIGWLLLNEISNSRKEAEKFLSKEYNYIVEQLNNQEFIQQYDKITISIVDGQNNIKRNFLIVICDKYKKIASYFDKNISTYADIVINRHNCEMNLLMGLDLDKKVWQDEKQLCSLFKKIQIFQEKFIEIERVGASLKYYNKFKDDIKSDLNKINNLFSNTDKKYIKESFAFRCHK